MRRIIRPRVALSVLVIGLTIAGVLWWWNSGPSPESEVRAYYETINRADDVSVLDCKYSEDPGGSVNNAFLCQLEGTQGRRYSRCFLVPRSASRFWRHDEDAVSYGEPPRPESCFEY